MTTPVNTPAVKVSLPEFHGVDSDEWSEFVGAFRIELLRNPTAYPTDTEKVTMAMSLFRGEALQWLNTKTDDDLGSYAGSWGVFMRAVRDQFGLGDEALKQVHRTALDALQYSHKDPLSFFATARTHMAMMGVNADVSMVANVWHKIPTKAKEVLVARGTYSPSWVVLREVCAVTATLSQPSSKKGKKPKCAHCGKNHGGECRSKN